MILEKKLFETIYEILRLSGNGSEKTHMMREAGLSSQKLEKYLTVLLEKNLMDVKREIYNTTQRGRLFMKRFEKLEDSFNPEVFGQDIIHHSL